MACSSPAWRRRMSERSWSVISRQRLRPPVVPMVHVDVRRDIARARLAVTIPLCGDHGPFIGIPRVIGIPREFSR